MKPRTRGRGSGQSQRRNGLRDRRAELAQAAVTAAGDQETAQSSLIVVISERGKAARGLPFLLFALPRYRMTRSLKSICQFLESRHIVPAASVRRKRSIVLHGERESPPSRIR